MNINWSIFKISVASGLLQLTIKNKREYNW